MMKAQIHRLRSATCLAVLALLASCLGRAAAAVDPAQQRRGAAAGAQQIQRPVLVVRTVSMPEYLDRRAIIYRSSDSELKRFPDVVWAERPGESVTRWMARSWPPTCRATRCRPSPPTARSRRRWR